MVDTPEAPQTTNDKLYAFLKRKGWSQAEFARRVGMERQLVNSWLTKGKKPSVRKVLQIADKLGWQPQTVNRDLGFGIKIPEEDALPYRDLVKELQRQVRVLTERLDELVSTGSAS